MRKLIFSAAAVIALAFSFTSCESETELLVYKDIRWALDQPTGRFGSTMVFDWEYKAPPKVDVWFLVKTFFKSDSSFSLEGQKMDAEHFFATIFNGLTFYSDGCVTAFYKPKPYLVTADWKESAPKNLVTYEELAEKKTIYLTPNPDMIEEVLAVNLGTEKAKVITDALRSILPEKIVTNYELSSDRFTLYLTKESIESVFSAFLPLIGFSDLVEELNACIENTESLKIGFNFHTLK